MQACRLFMRGPALEHWSSAGQAARRYPPARVLLYDSRNSCRGPFGARAHLITEAKRTAPLGGRAEVTKEFE
jgi:hypothetical protein